MLCTYIYIYIIHTYIHRYIYIYRERETLRKTRLEIAWCCANACRGRRGGPMRAEPGRLHAHEVGFILPFW